MCLSLNTTCTERSHQVCWGLAPHVRSVYPAELPSYYFPSVSDLWFGGVGGGSSYILIFPTNFLCFPSPMIGAWASSGKKMVNCPDLTQKYSFASCV